VRVVRVAAHWYFSTGGEVHELAPTEGRRH
jgi:hypothetical protein